MHQPATVPVKIYLAACAAISWFAIVLQFYLILIHRRHGVTTTIIHFFSYFTILTNILVAVCFTRLLLSASSTHFFTNPKTLTATAVYITVVGAIYNLVLRQIWDPQGWQLIADNLLHAIVPLLFVFYWLFRVPKDVLLWKDFLPWLIYPFIYLMYIIIRGAFTGWYPYPFVDVASYGYAKVLMNSGGMLVFFILLSLFFIGLAKMMVKFSKAKAASFSGTGK